MADVIYNTDYKLRAFGVANVQVLIGWHNNIDLPVVNGRTTKILRYFGVRCPSAGLGCRTQDAAAVEGSR